MIISEVRIGHSLETIFYDLNLITLPRVGENLTLNINGANQDFTVTKVWHWAGETQEHLIVIYVERM